MKRFLYPVFAVLTSVVLVLGGFSFSSQQGRFCAFEVQRAEAAVPLTAPYIFGALLGCFGVSVAGYAGANGQDVETALNNAWDSFQAFASADVVQAFQESFALFTSPVMPLSALNITSLMYQTVADWLLSSDTYISSTGSSFSGSYNSNPYNYSLHSYGSFWSSIFPVPDGCYPFFGTLDSNGNPNMVMFSSDVMTISKIAIRNYGSTPYYYSFIKSAPSGATSLPLWQTSSSGVHQTNTLNLPYSSEVTWTMGTASSIDDVFFFDAQNYAGSVAGSVSVNSSNAVTGVPDSVSSAVSSGSAEAYGQAVEDAVSGQNISIDSATVENPAWTDVFGEIAATLESIQAAIESGLAGVLEGVQTFFRPVVEFFAPLDIRDSDDIGDLVISNVSKEHTFTTKFPFCLVNDYKSLYEKAISPVGGSSDYPTPGHFVVKLPSMNGLNSQPITLDMTYVFTNKYMGLTLGQISQLFVAIACLAMFLHWVGDMINVVKSPNYGYVTVEGEAVGRGR